MADHCPTCGAEVRPRSADEGTMHFEVIAERRLRALQEAVEMELCAGTSGWHDRLRVAAVASGVPVFQIEVEDPYAADDSREEHFECVGAKAAGMRWEDLVGMDSDEAAELLEDGEELKDVDEETGREVTARRKES